VPPAAIRAFESWSKQRLREKRRQRSEQEERRRQELFEEDEERSHSSTELSARPTKRRSGEESRGWRVRLRARNGPAWSCACCDPDEVSGRAAQTA
jgi:hypothetical protein